MDRGAKRPSRLARRSTAVNYAALDEGELEDVAPVNFEEIRKALLGVRDGPETSYDSLEPLSLTRSWIEETGFRQPVYVPAAANAAEALGIQLPASEALRVQALAEQLGYGAEVATLDGVGQGPGPRWSMYQWLQYWRAREALVKETQNPKDGQGGGIKRRLSDSSIEDEADSRQVKAGLVAQEDAAGLLAAPGVRRNLSEESRARLLHTMLSLAGTPLQTCMSAPAAARESDLAAKVWPEGEGGRPRVDLFLAMTPAGCFTDFRIDYGGASLWIHVITGRRVFVLIPPTERNLATYAAWAGGSLQGSVFLANHAEGVVRVNLGPGDTFLIPGGWAYADSAVEASVALCGNFLHSGNLRLQAEVCRLEGLLGVRAQHRYPAFQQVMWYTAALFAARLRRLSSLTEEQLAERVRPAVEARAAAKARAAELAAVRAATKLSPVGRAPSGRLTHRPEDSEDTEGGGAGVGRSSRGRPLKINRAVKRFIESEDEGSDDMRPAPGGRGEGAATRPRRVNAGAKGRGWADEASWESSGETASSTSPVRHPAKRRAGRPLVESSDEDSTEQALKSLRAQQAARKRGATGPLQGALPARPSLVVRLPQPPQAEAGIGRARPSMAGAESLERGTEAQPRKLRLKKGKRSPEGDKPGGPLKVRLLATGTAARGRNLPQVDGAARTPPASCSASPCSDADESDSGDGPRLCATGERRWCLRGASPTSHGDLDSYPEGCFPSRGRAAGSAGRFRIERSRAGLCIPQLDGVHDSSETSDQPASGRQDGSAEPITDAQAALHAILNMVPGSAPGANIAAGPAASRESGRAAIGPPNEPGAGSNGRHDGAHREIESSRGGLATDPHAPSESGSPTGIAVEQVGHVVEDEVRGGGMTSEDMRCGTASAVSVPPDVDVGRMRIFKPIIHPDALLGSPNGGDSSPGRAGAGRGEGATKTLHAQGAGVGPVEPACYEELPTSMAVPEEAGGHAFPGVIPAQSEGPAQEPGAKGPRAEEEHETKAEPRLLQSNIGAVDEKAFGGGQHDEHPPDVLTEWEREGLPVLVLALRRMLGSAEGRRAVPAAIPDPELLLDEMEQLMLSLGFPALQSVQLVDFGTVASDSLTPLPSIAALAGRSRAKSQAASPDDDADLSDRGKVPSGLESLDEEAADSVEVAAGRDLTESVMEGTMDAYEFPEFHEAKRSAAERKVWRNAAGGRGGGGGAGVGAKKGGKLSVKNRLMKKLKIK